MVWNTVVRGMAEQGAVMTPLGAFLRNAAGARTPQAGVPVQVDAGTARSVGVARALASLMELLERARAEVDAPTGAGVAAMESEMESEMDRHPEVRDGVRALAARSREGAMRLAVGDHSLVFGDDAGLSAAASAEPGMEELRRRLVRRGVGAITVHQGAAPGELFTLASWLLEQPANTDPIPEMLRTWSVHVLPAEPSGADAGSDAGDGPGIESGSPFSRLSSARSDVAMESAVDRLIDAIDDGDRRGDAIAIESAARACMAELHTVGSGPGRLAIERALRRLLYPSTMRLLASRVPASTDRAVLIDLLARGGDESVAVLLQLLLDADDGVARRAYFDGIVAMGVGSAPLIDALSDARWFVVRSAAALLGEMGVEHADVALRALLASPDDRIRIAGARALMRLRTPAALAGVQSLIGDSHPEIRRLAAAGYGLSGTMPDRSRPPAGPLSDALDREQDQDVALEIIAAMGRLGGSHSAQRLLRLALQSGDPALRAPAWTRVAALEAMVQARGHAMLPAIETLMTDSDRTVADAAERLQHELQHSARRGAAISDR